MIEEQRFFVIRDFIALLGLQKKSFMQRLQSRRLGANTRFGQRAFELNVQKHELRYEIVSILPDSPQLTLCEFEKIVIKRLRALAVGRDRKVSRTLKLLCDEFAQLRAEIDTFNAVPSNEDSHILQSPAIVNTKKERRRYPLLRPPTQILDFQKMNNAISNE